LRRNPSAPSVVLYADPLSSSFAKAHSRLKDLANRGKIDYVLRPYLRDRPAHKTRLSGEFKGIFSKTHSMNSLSRGLIA
jgi:hypothetical protein